ncbi:cupin domain-containing protein [Dyadobacter flavalbus]|uniref:Cupin domain-containing protein n=1 Tax=Dyadobacter flavalbus TaxID=2579942 RepID=A0A5M8QX75_9BACT|nr:cupin domain-containing protein [Dyadobacter flavalbus]KAA6440877.1 cupin domain-containing protein [Dyadobacter flavalbus]
MKHLLKITAFICCLLAPTYDVNAQRKKNDYSEKNTSIFPRGQRVPANNFTGKAWVQQLILPDSAFNIPVGNVTFEAGARTYWHSHPGGQALLALDGVGYYQEKGKEIQVLRKGDTIKCPPNTPHWHGASPETGFTQIAITPNTSSGRVNWLQPVTDQEYSSFRK